MDTYSTPIRSYTHTTEGTSRNLVPGSMTNPTSKNVEGSDSLSLIHAMKLADVIRKHYHGEANNSSFSGIPPGVLQGVAAFIATGALLLPFRRILLRQAGNQPGGKPFQNFVDISITVAGALGATQVGLFIGSLYGSQVYLDLLRKESPSSNSPLTDSICQNLWSNVLPPHLHGASAPSNYSQFDPRRQTLLALKSAMESCRRRKEYKMSTSTKIQLF